MYAQTCDDVKFIVQRYDNTWSYFLILYLFLSICGLHYVLAATIEEFHYAIQFVRFWIWQLWNSLENTSDLQFGSKPGISTTMCTAVYMETVNYYTCRNTDVYSCLLDASGAFDKVHYGKLFKWLIKRILPLLIVRLLFICYTHQQVCVSWESYKSRYFGVVNGVKQGGVISLILFKKKYLQYMLNAMADWAMKWRLKVNALK